MQTNLILTLTGADRVGLVEAVTKVVLDHGGNVETSRMSRLGGAFAILMLVSISAAQATTLQHEFESLVGQGYKVTLSQTTQTETHVGWLPYQIEVNGADHEGIIHHVAQSLAQCGINIESMDTETTSAPMSGAPLFSMTAMVVAPPSVSGADWEADLLHVARQLNVDIVISKVNHQ